MAQSHLKVSVMMPVYNGEKYLREAIESILHQSFTEFEFIIVNDGSKDRSIEIVESYSDSRIKLIHNQTNLGLSSSLNKGLKIAQGDYIARMDCDDISLPQRLEKQVTYLDEHPEVVLVGTQIVRMDSGGRTLPNYLHLPQEPITIRLFSCFDSPFAHPSVMFRKAVVWDKMGGYDETILTAQDYALWSRLIRADYLTHNFAEALVRYRVHPTSITFTKKHELRMKNIQETMEQNLQFLFPEYAREAGIICQFNCYRHADSPKSVVESFNTLVQSYQTRYELTKESKDFTITTARIQSNLAYELLVVSRRAALQLYTATLKKWPAVFWEIPWAKVCYLLLLGKNGKNAFLSIKSYLYKVAK